MSFFKRLFSTEPSTLLDKAERALAGGTPVQTLAFLDRLPDALPDELRSRADALDDQAHGAIALAASERALGFEEAGMREQAADNLSLALEHCRDGELRAELEERLERAQPVEHDEALETEEDEESGEVEEVDASYLTLVSMLNEGVAERYDDRPDSFQQAYVDLNEGRAAEALATFESLVREAPDDPVGPLERGRCLLFLERIEEAQRDFDTAWAVFGDDPLDNPGTLSLPLLWAETAMDLKQHDLLVERLAEPAQADRGQPLLSHVLALSRIELGQLDEAAEHLGDCVSAFPREPVFPQVLAQVLVAQDDSTGAIETLERAVAPSCAGGGCRAPALHLPSVRLLAGLHLDAGGTTDRARELVTLIAGSRRGRLEWQDLSLLARCERQEGDEVACADLLAQARALVPSELEQIHAQLDALEAVNE